MSVARAAAILAVLSVATMVGVVIAGHRDATGSPMGLDDAYVLMAGAMSRPGMVLHITPVQLDDDGCKETTEAWIEEGGSAVRISSYFDCYDGQDTWSTVSLSVLGGQYVIDRDGKPLRGAIDGCRGTDLPGILFFIGCEGDDKITSRARRGLNFEGRSVVEIHSTGEFPGIDSWLCFDGALYVDPLTGLPVARRDVTLDYCENGRGEEFVDSRDFRHDYVVRSELPADFFAPRGIGVTSTYPVSLIKVDDLEMPTYWFGESLPATATLPGLKLQDHYVINHDERDYAMLGYRWADAEFGPSAVEIWTRAPDRSAPPELQQGSSYSEGCYSEEDIFVPGAVTAAIATKRTTDGCFGGYYAASAVIDFGASRVQIQIWKGLVDSGEPNPYASRAALIELAQALLVLD